MFRSIIDNSVGQLLGVLAPARCHLCGSLGQAPVCRACAAGLPWNRGACRACALPVAGFASGWDVCGACLADAPPQDSTWAAFTYGTPVAQHLVGLKFHGRLASAHVLGVLMAERLARRPQPLPDVLMPVPLHPARLRRRGYNQAAELARELGRRLAIPVEPTLARRVRPTGEQTRLDATARRRNVRGAFLVEDCVAGRHVAILDDVITTGATAAELARAARSAGAAQVEVWAAARAL